MSRVARQSVLVAIFLVARLALHGQAQDTTAQGRNGAPAAATGLGTNAQMSENPPISGLDEPKFEPGFGARSYLAPKVEVSENLDSNTTGNFSRSNISDTTRLLGSLDLQKLWKQ